MAYNNLDVGMNLKYAKSERAGHGRVLGWSLQNGVAYVELYFPDGALLSAVSGVARHEAMRLANLNNTHTHAVFRRESL